METFDLAGHAYIELHKLLKITGLALSGGEAKALIADGQVTVDGVVELRKRCKIQPGQVVAFAGSEIRVGAA